MQTYIWLTLSVLAVISSGVGVYLFVKSLPKISGPAKRTTPKYRKAQSSGKDANEQIQDLLRDFEEKWRNRQ